ncbi:hypothetical protein [Cellulomonas denverensis]|uniref:Secreted protein n=1 Tax=Cellulomonas denverensis TaxID=264297 RepID=A0A7X6QXS1_9CELL|nr:hypothetical protein [Cellulomonas denverensis]NKY21221.1 hypothetical protein [Cellulomonas denverensis]GIG24512.1 hypothetical protein Cde04nite_07560 [Cellulomonas denverensis]
MRRSAHLTLGAVLALGLATLGGVTLAGPASAATPGSACTIYLIEGNVFEEDPYLVAYPGTVNDTTVSYCVPNMPIQALLGTNINLLGVQCAQDVLGGVVPGVGRADCPN